MNIDSGLILSAGMPRSASTWMYNADRLIFANKPQTQYNFGCGWVDVLKEIPSKPLMLIKIHDYVEELASQAAIILYSYRDIRDAIASQVRKWGVKPTLEIADHIVYQHSTWMGIARP